MEHVSAENSSKAVTRQPAGFFDKKNRPPFFASLPVQPKLTIGPADDPYEREADAIADKVMRMSEDETLQTKPSPLSIQRKCAACEEEEQQSAQRACAHCEEEEKLQLKHSTGDGGSLSAPPQVHEAINSTGRPLDAGTRGFMESRFGYDFGNVQVHNDSLAHHSSAAIDALAYTHGNHVVFGAGQYRPDSHRGRELLAHELVHVVQQGQNNFLSPTVSRAVDTATIENKDGSVVTVGRIANPGKCKLEPKTQTETTGSVTSRGAFMQFDFCRGTWGGKVKGELEYGDAIDDASKATTDFFNNISRGQNPQQAFQGLKQEIENIAPGAKVEFKFRSRSVSVDAGGTGRGSIDDGVSGEGKVGVEVDVGSFVIGVEAIFSGGTQQDAQGQIMVTIKNSDGESSPADCHVCNCSEPEITYFCSQKQKPGGGTPYVELLPKVIPLYFEYITTAPRTGWEQSYEAMVSAIVDLIEDGYSIERIQGNASPEGPLKARKSGAFENTALAEKRADEAWTDIEKEIQIRLKYPFTMRYKELRTALSKVPPSEGSGEVLGSSGESEVKNSRLFDYITKIDTAATAEGRDIFAENNLTGADLPEEISAENDRYITEFRTGEREETGKSLKKEERLESLYKTMRRALVFLKPPTRDLSKVDLKVKPDESIGCSSAHIKFLNDTIPLAADLFEGDCKKDDETRKFIE